jgi:hypothetical protein
MLVAGGPWWGMSLQLIGEVAFITVGGIVLGYLILKVWPKFLNPPLFAIVVPLLIAAGFAYMGSAGAAIALILLLTVGVGAMFLGIG